MRSTFYLLHYYFLIIFSEKLSSSFTNIIIIQGENVSLYKCLLVLIIFIAVAYLNSNLSLLFLLCIVNNIIIIYSFRVRTIFFNNKE
jgi:hypothetical protein